MLGISALLALTTAIASTAEVVGDVAHDNAVDFKDLSSLGKAVSAISDLTEVNFDDVLPEIQDLNGEEQEELAAHFAEKFKLENLDREKTIEEGFGYLLKGLEAFLLLKKLSDKIKA